MARVQFTSHLRRFFPALVPCEVQAATVAELVWKLDIRYPGIAGYLVEDSGALRKHVNIFIGQHGVRDRVTLSDALGADDEVFVLQALSGG